jgi:putative phosphoesterase
LSESRGVIVGVVADTHGLLRPELLEVFKDVDLIIHAGDVGKERVLNALRALAPTIAVRGNVDQGAWAQPLPRTEHVEVAGVKIYIHHGHEVLELDPGAAGYRVVVSGHSHKSEIRERDGVLYLNPGSAGPRRFKLPVTAMRLLVRGETIEAKLVSLLAAG